MLRPQEITAQALQERLSVALTARSEHVSNIKRFKGEVAEALGRDVRTIESWMYGESLPSADALLKLFSYFGAEFANEVLGLAGFLCSRVEDAEIAQDGITLKRMKTALTQIKGLIADVQRDLEAA